MPFHGTPGPIPYNAAMSSLPTRVRIVETGEFGRAILKREPESKVGPTIATKRNKATS